MSKSAVIAGFAVLVISAVAIGMATDSWAARAVAATAVVGAFAWSTRSSHERERPIPAPVAAEEQGRPIVTSSVHAVLLFVVRGLLLWIVLPLGITAAALVSLLDILQRRRRPSVKTVIWWFDAALVALLNRTVLRAFGGNRRWPRWGQAPHWQLEAGDLL